MPKKRSLADVESGKDRDEESRWSEEDDDFYRDALRDQERYQSEAQAERKAMEEAQKTNRRYVKKKKKSVESLPDARQQAEEKRALFESLRMKLQLDGQEAEEIKKASIKSLRKKKQLEQENADDDDVESSVNPSAVQEQIGGERSNDEEEEDAVVLSTRRVELDRSERTSNELYPQLANETETDSDEEAVVLSMPKRASLPATLEKQTVDSTLTKQESTTVISSINAATELDASSDDEIISLSVPVRRQLVKPEVQAEDATPPHAQRATPAEQQPTEAPVASVATTQPVKAMIQPDGSNRPAFPMTEGQLSVGPLRLDNTIEVPASINRFLRDYQREGVRFFYSNYKRRRGALLGDDMGLGKTIQVIAFLSAIMGKKGKESIDKHRRINSVRAGRAASASMRQRSAANGVWPTALIVCPASVMTNWQNELDTWGYFEHALLDDDSLRDFQRGRLDILITSHQTAARRIMSLNEQSISVVFVDECHTLKNPKSLMTIALNSIPCQCRFGLTGTAMQNRYEEFWTLLDWCNPRQFGSLRDWEQLVAEPIRKGQSHSATMEQIGHSRRIAIQLRDCLLPPYFLRRTKMLIKAQLPDKRDNIVFCPLTPLQIASYKSILSEPEVELIRRAKEPCECGRLDTESGLPYRRSMCCFHTDEEGRRWNYHMLKYIMLLQRCSNHLALVFPDPQDNIDITADSNLADKTRKSRYLRQIEIVKQLFPDSWQTKQNNKLNGFRTEYCGKWLVLRGFLSEWKRAGDKVLLFSLNLRLLDWIAYFVEVEGYKHLRLDGSTPQKKRQALVNDFNRDASIFVFLISTTAGGTGLNLTGANKVVIFDPHWNPAHDLQAMDRAYRFGQTKDVDVYRLIGRGSLEETIYDRQVYKQQLGRIGYDASEERRYFEPSDAKGFEKLFVLHQTGSVTQDLIKACDLKEAAYAMQHFVEEAEVTKIKVEQGEEEGGGSADLGSLTAGDVGDDLDPVARLLHMTGIEYTHVNDGLFGGSKVEAAISKQAREMAGERGISSTSEGKEKRAMSKTPRGKKETSKVKEEGGKGEAATSSNTPSWPPPRKKAVRMG